MYLESYEVIPEKELLRSLGMLTHPRTYFFGRVPMNPILGFVIRTYKKVGSGWLRLGLGFKAQGF